MKHEHEQSLCGSRFVSKNLKAKLLQSLKVLPTVVSQEIECKLDRLDFGDDELDHAKRIGLLMDQLDNFWLFNQNWMDKLNELVLEFQTHEPKFIMEHACVINVELFRLMRLTYGCLNFLIYDHFLFLLFFLTFCQFNLGLLYLTEAKNFD